MTEMKTGRLPNLLVIGAMKSGTTTLCEELARHPEVFFPETKEPNALVRHALGEPRALEDYAALYGERPEAVLADGSTGNSKVPHRPNVAGLAARILPKDVRILYITRDPIARIERHLAHNLGNGLICDASDALFSTPEYVATSAYEMQLSFWRAHFPPESILVVTLEAYQEDRAATLTRIFRHIGLDPYPVLQLGILNANRGDSRRSAYRSPFRALIHSRLYLRVRERIPRSLRRTFAEALLPRARQAQIQLSADQRAAALRAIQSLNDLEAPTPDQIEAVLEEARSGLT